MAGNFLKKTYRILTDPDEKVWSKVAFWTTGDQVEMKNGKSLEENIGSITGITDSLTDNNPELAASAKAVYDVNAKLGGMKFGINGDGDYGYYKGDDTFVPFSSGNLERDAVALITPTTYKNSSGAAGIWRGATNLNIDCGTLASTATGQTTWTCTKPGKYIVYENHKAAKSKWTISIKGKNVFTYTPPTGNVAELYRPGMSRFAEIYDMKANDTIVSTLAASTSAGTATLLIVKADNVKEPNYESSWH